MGLVALDCGASHWVLLTVAHCDGVEGSLCGDYVANVANALTRALRGTFLSLPPGSRISAGR